MVKPGDEIRNKMAVSGVDIYFTDIEVRIIEGTTDGAQTVAYKLKEGLTETESDLAKKALLEIANEFEIHAITAEF